MAAVQYYGRQAILKAYNDRGISVWGIFSGRDLMTEGDSVDALDGWLQTVEGNTAAEYKLCFYRDLESASEVEQNTPYTSCYKVTLRDPSGAAGMGGVVSRAGSLDPITAQVNAYIAGKVGKIIKDELEGEKEEKRESLTDILVGLLREPEKIAGLINVGKALLGQVPISMPAAIAGPTQVKRAGSAAPSSVAGTETAEEILVIKYNRIESAIARLEKCDPDFVSRLEKLATLAETNPSMYSMAVKMLG